jgi:diphthine-ammonia ligase
MRLVSLLSGGKDSTYSTYLAQKEGHEVKDAIIFVPATDSYMFHRPNAKEAVKIAEAMGLNPIVKETEGIKEKELDDLKDALLSVDADGVIAGAIASRYQFERVKRICDELGLKVYTPLWQRDQTEVMEDMLKEGFEIMVVSVSAYGLGEEWLGRIIDEKALEELKKIEEKYRINVSGEGGEYETMVINGPNFRYPLKPKIIRKEWKRDYGWIEVKLSV